jgi:cyclopropane-fatty-acyl-phospholipid synthase
MSLLLNAVEKGIVPDVAVRYGIRKLCRERLRSLTPPNEQIGAEENAKYVAMLKASPLAVHTDAANEQHYELPQEFFGMVLGKNRKYSSAYWPAGCASLDQAEEEALNATVERAQIHDGMRILELGCGWGSLTLFMAQKFPQSQILALSNSQSQREYILAEAAKRSLKNVNVITRNIVDTEDLAATHGFFHRIVSVEMFEHLRNYEALFDRLEGWLSPNGMLFVHIFTHRAFSYTFEVEGEDNWMGRYFFTGGQMPARDLLTQFQRRLVLRKQWNWNGTHYGKTSEAWLRNMDAHKAEIIELFKKTYGPDQAGTWFNRWRVFFMSCAELFNYRHGREWGVSHYLFSKA